MVRYRYDTRGNRTYEERQINQEVKQVLRYGYDKAGRLIEQKEELNSGLTPIPGEERFAITRYRYDENGNRTEIITPEGYRIIRAYDSCDRLISERSVDKANGIDRTVLVSYDKAGNMIKVTRQGKGTESWEIAYTYDLKDRITHVKDCLGPVFQYEYNKNDQMEQEILPQAGEKHELFRGYRYHYDSKGNLLERKDAVGTVLEQNEYLPDGNLPRRVSANGNELTFTYGMNRQQTEVSTTRSKKKGQAAQAYTYDSRGRITGLADGNQNHTRYESDHWGRICQVEGADGGREGYTYEYRPDGKLLKRAASGRTLVSCTYLEDGSLKSLTDESGRAVDYGYDWKG